MVRFFRLFPAHPRRGAFLLTFHFWHTLCNIPFVLAAAITEF